MCWLQLLEDVSWTSPNPITTSLDLYLDAMANDQPYLVPNPLPLPDKYQDANPFSAPPRDLFWCQGEHKIHQDYPNLIRFNIRNHEADVIDRFFRWHDRYGILDPSALHRDPSTAVLMIEVIQHNGADSDGSSYFAEHPRRPGQFERIMYENGNQVRMRKLKLKATVFLKCKEHGCSWEVNVLG